MKKLFSAKLRTGFAPLLIIGLVAIVVFIAFVTFGPLSLVRLGQLSSRVQQQESHAAVVGTGVDTDGDGFDDQTEQYLGTDPYDNCGAPVDATKPGKPSLANPADLWTDGTSFGKLDLQDVSSFTAPVRRFGTSPGMPNYDKRWDVYPGRGLFTSDINLQDITTLSVLTPPMLNGNRAYGSPACVEYNFSATPSGMQVTFSWTTIPSGNFQVRISDMTVSGRATCVSPSDILNYSSSPTLSGNSSWVWNGGVVGHQYCASIFSNDKYISNFVKFTVSGIVLSAAPTSTQVTFTWDPAPNFDFDIYVGDLSVNGRANCASITDIVYSGNYITSGNRNGFSNWVWISADNRFIQGHRYCSVMQRAHDSVSNFREFTIPLP